MYRFNVPDNWALPYDFVPEKGWRPNLSWGAPPSNWQWWVLEDYDPNPRLPPVVDKGDFNSHPVEVAAVAAEREYVRSIEQARSAVQRAAATRKEREIADPSSHLYKIREEEYAEECIQYSMETRVAALEKRFEADRVHSEWLKRGEAEEPDLLDSLLSEFPDGSVKTPETASSPVAVALEGQEKPEKVEERKEPEKSGKIAKPLGPPPPLPSLSLSAPAVSPKAKDMEASEEPVGAPTAGPRRAMRAAGTVSAFTGEEPVSRPKTDAQSPSGTGTPVSSPTLPLPPNPPVAPDSEERRKHLPDWFKYMDGLIGATRSISVFNYRKRREELTQELQRVKEDVEVCNRAMTGRGLRVAEEKAQKATADSHRLIAEARAEAQKIISDAKQTSQRTVSDAEQKARRIVDEAQQKAVRTVSEAETKSQRMVKEATRTVEELREEADSIVFNQIAYYDYEHPAASSVQLQDRLGSVKTDIKDMIRSKEATSFDGSFSFNGSVAQGRKFVNKLSSLMLTAYNQEVENAIVKANSGKNLELALKRLDTARTRVSKLGEMIDLSINPAFHHLRVEELKLTFEYKDQLELEKELERERRAVLREEERVRQEAEKEQLRLDQEEREAARRIEEQKAELERQRIAKLEYEESHYENALQQAEAIRKLNASETLIAELQAKLAEIRNAKEKVVERIANTRAGYVYVISNIGAFGEGIVKIGLTRRQEPLDRVKELSSASVPFPFDVHAIQFSHDAVELETSLHRYFKNRKVNKVNPRKEYFYATPEEVRDAMKHFADGPLLSFRVEAPAEQWRQSRRDI